MAASAWAKWCCRAANWRRDWRGASPESGSSSSSRPVALNIVCFRFRGGEGLDLDTLNREIVADLQEGGIAVPSTTMLAGKLAIRAALINHRTEWQDLEALVDGVLDLGRRRIEAQAPAVPQSR